MFRTKRNYGVMTSLKESTIESGPEQSLVGKVVKIVFMSAGVEIDHLEGTDGKTVKYVTPTMICCTFGPEESWYPLANIHSIEVKP